MIRFGWLSIVLLIGAVQGAVVAGLLFARPHNRTANRLLGAFLLAFVAQIVPYIIGFAGFYEAYPWLSFAPFAITLAYGPLLYLYVVRITGDGLPRRWWMHFIPALVQAAYYLVIFPQPLAFKDAYDVRIHERFVDPAEALLTAVSLVAYLVASFRRFGNYDRWLREATSDPARFGIAWLFRYLVLFAGTVALKIGFEAYSWFVHQLSYYTFFWLYAVFAALAYYLALEGWRTAQAVYPLPAASADPPPAVNVEAEALAWRGTVIAAGYWRDPDLSLASLAERMHLSSGQISRLVNDGLGQNFSETINRMRVEAVQERLRDPSEKRDVLELAFDCGFNSKASFNRSFKTFTGTTPTQFRASATGEPRLAGK